MTRCKMGPARNVYSEEVMRALNTRGGLGPGNMRRCTVSEALRHEVPSGHACSRAKPNREAITARRCSHSGATLLGGFRKN